MEAVIEILQALPGWIMAACEVVGGVAGLATAIVRLTPSSSDNKVVARLIRQILKLMSYLPTIGINPETRRLKDDLKSLRR